MVLQEQIETAEVSESMCVCVCVCACMHACVRACVHVCVYICLYADTCVYVGVDEWFHAHLYTPLPTPRSVLCAGCTTVCYSVSKIMEGLILQQVRVLTTNCLSSLELILTAVEVFSIMWRMCSHDQGLPGMPVCMLQAVTPTHDTLMPTPTSIKFSFQSQFVH